MDMQIEFIKRLLFFKNLVNERFSFLQSFDYQLTNEEMGQTENFKDYFIELTFSNEETLVKIHFSTDILNGMKTALPQLENEELPNVDSQITCSIWDKNAFLSIFSYVQIKFPEISKDYFTIKLGSPDLESEIKRVTNNYSDFIKTNLKAVLEKKIIYNCYIDRFYKTVFEEINYH